MIDPNNGDINDFPPWIWPYINVARLAEVSKTVTRVTEDQTARVPDVAIAAHVTAIISALTMRKVAAGLEGDLGRQFNAAANRALSVAIDDCGSTGTKPWPRPPKSLLLHQIAANLAIAAVELEGDEILHNGLKEAMAGVLKRAG